MKLYLTGRKADPHAVLRDRDGIYRQGISSDAISLADDDGLTEDPQLAEWLERTDNAKLFVDVRESCSIEGFLPGDRGPDMEGDAEPDVDEDPEAWFSHQRRKAAKIRERIENREERIAMRRKAYEASPNVRGRNVLTIIEAKQAKDIEELREIEDILIGSSHPEVEPMPFRVTDDPLDCTSASLAKPTGPLH